MQVYRLKGLKPKIALIDSSVNDAYVKSLLKRGQKVIDVLKVSNQQVMPDEKTSTDILSHATLCSKIFLDHVTCDCELIYLNIWEGDEVKANINDLCAALSWCLENDIQLINLSLGTTRLTDVPELLIIINQLIVNGVLIVAASSNQRKLTFPAAFDQVIGVKAIFKNRKQKAGFIYHENPIDRLQISCYVPDELLIYKGEYYHLNASNSLATSVISAKICDLLSQGYASLDEIKEQLKSQSLTKMPKQLQKIYKSHFQNKIEIPVIAILNDGCTQFIKELEAYFLNHGYQGICLSADSETNFSANIINVVDFKDYSLMKKLRFYAHYGQVDYVIIDMNKPTLFAQMEFKEIDLILYHSSFDIPKVKRKATCLSFADEEDFTGLFDQVYHYLSV